MLRREGMRRIISFCLFFLVTGCSDMGGGQYRFNNETIGEFFRTGSVMQDKSVAMRADAPKSSGGSVKSGAHLTGTTLVVNRGCWSGTGSWAKNVGGNWVEVNFDDDYGLTAVISPKLDDDAFFRDCICRTGSYCEMTIKNVVKKREKALDGSWFEAYDGISMEKSAEIIAYKKLR